MARQTRRNIGAKYSPQASCKFQVLVFFLQRGTRFSVSFTIKLHPSLILVAPQTRYEDEEKGAALHLKAGGARGKHFFLKEAQTKKDKYDVRKGREGFNESLPEEISRDRALPKPPNLATMCVLFL